MKRILIVLLILAALLTGCATQADTKDSNPRQTNTFDGPRKDELGDDQPGEDVMKFSDTTIIVSFNEIPTETQLREVEKLCEGELKNMIMDSIAVISFEPKTSKAIKALAEKLSQLDYVKVAEPDYIIEMGDCHKVPC